MLLRVWVDLFKWLSVLTHLFFNKLTLLAILKNLQRKAIHLLTWFVF